MPKRATLTCGSIRKLPSGRFNVRLLIPGSRPARYYSHPDGTFPTKAAAERAIRHHAVDIDNGTWVHPDRKRALDTSTAMTVRDLAIEWCERKRGTVKSSTMVTYESRINVSILPHLGHLPATALTPDDVRNWYDQLGNTGAAERAYERLWAIYDYAHDTYPDLFPSQPCQMSKRTVGQRDRRPDSAAILVPDETIVDLAQRLPADYQLVVLLAGWCPLRIAEVLALQADRINLEHRTIRIDQQRQAKGDNRITSPKSLAAYRTIPYPQGLDAHLQRAVTNATPHPNQWLFRAKLDPSASLPQSTFERMWTAARNAANDDREAAGLPPNPRIRFHDLRHTALTRLGQLGATNAELQEFAGHRDLRTVMRYQHASMTRMQQLSDRIQVDVPLPSHD